MESIAGVEVDGQLRALRRLLYCGEWIESHTLHIFMLHAPDFLGVPSAVELAKIDPALVETALRLKKIGNEVMRVVGGREVHPINVRVGGWYKAPSRADLERMVPDLEWAKEASREAARVVAGARLPRAGAGLRVRRARRRRRVPDRPRRADRLEPRARLPDLRVLRPRRRGARRALECVARAPARARRLPRRPHGALRASPRAPLPRRARGGRRGGARAGRAESVPLDHRPRGRARARVRRGAAADRRVRAAVRAGARRSSRRPAGATARARRRAASSTTATGSTRPARSSTRRSSRRPRRTRR